MKLQQLLYFQAICKYRNISRASEELHVSQPALTAAMKALEEEFGTTLFLRRSKGMEPTPAGELLIRESEDLLMHAERLVHTMKCFGQERAVLRIGTAPMSATAVFPRLIRETQKLFPGIRLEITESGSARNLTLLKSDALDAAVLSGKLSLPAGFASCELMRVPLEFCTYPGHPLSARKQVSLSEIARYPLTLLGEDTYLTSYLTRRFAEDGISAQVSLKTNQLTMIGQLIRNNMTSSVLLSGVLPEDAGLVRLPIEDAEAFSVSLAWKDLQPLSYPLICLIRAARSMSSTD